MTYASKISMIIDIDNFLTKNHFQLLKYLKWPWVKTHFILSSKCFGCDFLTVCNEAQPEHFIIENEQYVKNLLHFNFFWCKNCLECSIYDHFPDDECELCLI